MSWPRACKSRIPRGAAARARYAAERAGWVRRRCGRRWGAGTRHSHDEEGDGPPDAVDEVESRAVASRLQQQYARVLAHVGRLGRDEEKDEEDETEKKGRKKVYPASNTTAVRRLTRQAKSQRS